MNFKLGEKSFKLNGKDFFLYSGEIHYFRVDAASWKKHLSRLKEAHCNTTSTYIPWDWHEYEEGKFDFDGKTHPQKNLRRYLDLCKELGIYVIVKPGPYIMAEYFYQGIPVWFPEKHPEVFCLNKDGERIGPDILTYMHPVFLDYVKKWYDRIMSLLKEYQISNGGPVIMMQVCNEVGLFQWLGGGSDYSPVIKEYYHKFLKELYKDTGSLNRVYHTNYRDFSEVSLLDRNINTLPAFARSNDWHAFWRWYYCIYMKFLFKEIRERGIDLQLTNNVAGWVYGGAEELPMNVTFYNEILKSVDTCLGIDHIPENVSFRNLHHDWPCNQILSSAQGDRPVWAAEFQAGTREHVVRTYPNELELFYKASIAHGLKGMNFYIFSQGINPKGKEGIGPIFYWETVLDNKGNKNDLYDVVSRIGKFVKTHAEKFIPADTRKDIGISFYGPYYFTELLDSRFIKFKKLDTSSMGLNYDPIFIRESIYFNGLLRVLQILNYDFGIHDIQSTALEKLLCYKQLWFVSLEYMDAETQNKLADYVKAGGHLIILPTLPHLDLSMQKCSLLKEKLGIQEKEPFFIKKDRMELFNLTVPTIQRQNIYNEKGSQIIARTTDGHPCGISKKIGKGKVTVLGTAFPYAVEVHISAYDSLVQTDRISKKAWADNPDLIVIERFAENCAYLFVGNYHPVAKEARIHYTHPVTGEVSVIPDKGTITIPGTYGMLLPINLQIPESNATIEYSTSDILDMNSAKNCLNLKICGPAALHGETVLCVRKRPKRATLDNKKVSLTHRKGRALLSYEHTGRTRDLKISF